MRTFQVRLLDLKKTINNKRNLWLCFLRQEHIWIHKQPSLQAPKFYLNHHTSKMFKRGVSHVLHGNLMASLAAGALCHQMNRHGVLNPASRRRETFSDSASETCFRLSLSCSYNTKHDIGPRTQKQYYESQVSLRKDQQPCEPVNSRRIGEPEKKG